MAATSTRREKFARRVGDLYDAEHRFLEAMQEMLGAAGDAKVRKMLKDRIRETGQQIRNLERVHALLDRKPSRIQCAEAAGLVAEGWKILEEASESPALRDCLIAGALARVDHHEIAGYTALIAAADAMGLAEILPLLRVNLDQETRAAARVEEAVPSLLKKALKRRGTRASKADGNR